MSAKKNKPQQSKKYFRLGVISGILVLLLLWFLISWAVDAPLIFPKPQEVFARLAVLFSKVTFYQAILKTTLRCTAAFFASMCLGFAGAYLCSKSPFFEGLSKSFLQIIKSVPVVAIILICLFFMKSAFLPSFIGFLMALPVVWDAVQKGFSSVEKREVAWAKIHGLGKMETFFFIDLHCARPFLQAASKTACSMIWKVCAAGEVLSLPRKALGSLLAKSQVSLESAETFAITLCIVVLSFAFSFAVKLLGKLLDLLFRKLVDLHFFRMEKKLGEFQKTSGKQTEAFVKNPDSSSVKIDSLTMKRDKILFENFSCIFEGSSISGICEASGLGKTSLLDWIAGLLDDEVEVEGTLSAPSEISYLFQKPVLLEDLTVIQNLQLAAAKFARASEKNAGAMELLKKASLEQKAGSFPSELSGGQRQAVALLQALIFDSRVLLLDEPFKSLDRQMQDSMRKILLENQYQRQRTVILVSHQAEDLELLGARKVVLSKD